MRPWTLAEQVAWFRDWASLPGRTFTLDEQKANGGRSDR